jgi:hypothetical protein
MNEQMDENMDERKKDRRQTQLPAASTEPDVVNATLPKHAGYREKKGGREGGREGGGGGGCKSVVVLLLIGGENRRIERYGRTYKCMGEWVKNERLKD